MGRPRKPYVTPGLRASADHIGRPRNRAPMPPSPSGDVATKAGKSAAIAYTLTDTAKFKNIDPQAWLIDALSGTPTTISSESAIRHGPLTSRSCRTVRTPNCFKCQLMFDLRTGSGLSVKGFQNYATKMVYRPRKGNWGSN